MTVSHELLGWKTGPGDMVLTLPLPDCEPWASDLWSLNFLLLVSYVHLL